jgi:hypothetical protein
VSGDAQNYAQDALNFHLQENKRLLGINVELLAVCKALNAIMTRMNESAQYEQIWYQLPPALLEAGRLAYKAIANAEQVGQ